MKPLELVEERDETHLTYDSTGGIAIEKESQTVFS